MASTYCKRCGIHAFDNANAMSLSSKIIVSEPDCSYMVEGKEYRQKCKQLAGDPQFPVTERCCPNMKQVIAIQVGWNPDALR